MENAQTGQLSLEEEAKRLIEALKTYHAGDCEPSGYKKREVSSMLDSLKARGLIATRSCAKVSDFVLRNAVHGSPLLILMTPSSSIVFLSLSFAQYCRDVLKEIGEEDNVQILQVVAEE